MAKTSTTLRIDADLKDQATRAAKAERRSFTSLIEHLLDQYVRAGDRERKEKRK